MSKLNKKDWNIIYRMIEFEKRSIIDISKEYKISRTWIYNYGIINWGWNNPIKRFLIRTWKRITLYN